ncbi:MAG: hypothetical protein Fur0032_19100 [Terrimicrobiaceae bacterium]
MSPPPPSAKPGLPQATVQLQKKPEVPASKSVSSSAINVVPTTTVAPQTSNEVSPVLGAVALAISLVALVVQLLMFL